MLCLYIYIYIVFLTHVHTPKTLPNLVQLRGQTGAELPAAPVDPSGGNHRMTTVPGNAWGACDSPSAMYNSGNSFIEIAQ